MYYWLLMQVRIYYCIIIHFLSTTKQIIGALYFCNHSWYKNLGRRSIDISYACKTCFEYIPHETDWRERMGKGYHLLIPVSSWEIFFVWYLDKKISLPYYERFVLFYYKIHFIKNIFYWFVFITLKYSAVKWFVLYHTTHFLFLLIYTIFLRNT